ncbi:hypothetical protein WDU94_010839 [Cyamophila willieti]
MPLQHRRRLQMNHLDPHLFPPSNVSSTPSNSLSDSSVATLRNVDNAIRDCVNSISAGLRVGSDVSTTGSISSSLNTLRAQSSSNTNLDSRFSKQQNASSSVINGTNSSNIGGATRNGVRAYPANTSPYEEEEGAASLESQFNSRPAQGASRMEVLRPHGSEPSDRMKPVNRPPLQTRRRNYQDDVLTEYMHLLEEQGLSSGLQTSSQNKPTRTTNTSRTINLLDTANHNGFNTDNAGLNPYNSVGARGLRDNNGRLHIAPRETVRERADRIRREREREELTALTRTTELRGLNQALTQERNVVNQAVDEEEALCLPCEFCDAPIPMDHLILHQTGCRPDLIYH